ncbi:exportin-5 isoform X2 [Paramuricea clavata]|uniref:Exportin-5 isoform X2 n=1 Tax=Paramuricea clavata TaxID=317549 RepID=A0A6S7G3P5_PARCT|nr:exportin-5 isoform X2 [Paramuricea clavata]
MALFIGKGQEAEVYHLSQQLAQAVEIILSPDSSRDKRVAATRVCEEFKNNTTYLTSCGIYLYGNHPNFIVKHYGLKLILHAIKFNWNEMLLEEKDNLKILSLHYIQGCTNSLLDEPTYLNDVIAKLTVEIMKREWPQNWPDIIDNLSEISQKGPSQLFTVLRTLLCLAEEATNVEGDLPPARRKDVMSSLICILEDLFKFFVKTLQLAVEKIKQMKAQTGDVKYKEVLLQKFLAESVLTTLCGYVEWVNIKFLVQENAILLQTLCLLLQEDEIRAKAAECLEAIAGRKGAVVERLPLLILVSMDALTLIFSSIKNIVENSDDSDDESHVFLKRVCNIFTLLGQTQLAVLWGAKGCVVEEPTHFHIYLEALISLHRHKNMDGTNHLDKKRNAVLTSEIINKTWASFLRNEMISNNPTFCSFIPQILEISKTKISRGLHPSLNPSKILYPDIDFGSFAEKFGAWTALRKSTKDIVQLITSLYPSDAFLHAATWVLKVTSTPMTSTEVTETSPEYYEWDSLTSFTNSVLNKLFSNDIAFIKDLIECQIRMENGTICFRDLAKKCIVSLVEYKTEAYLIQSSILLCFESFIPFLQFDYELLLKVIHKIFSIISYQPPNEGNHEAEFKAFECRRTAASVWIRICLSHHKLLINIIDDLTKHIQISYDQVNCNSLERSLMAEGLVVLSNGYRNFEKQSKYLSELLTPVREDWMSAEMEQALSSPEAFISFIGLDNANEEEFKAQKRRYTLNMCQRSIHGVLKRVEIPKDSQEQIKGGFKTRLQDEPRNPGTAVVLPLLSNALHLIRVLSSIWDPSVRVKIPHYFQPALEIHESEKGAIFGIDGRDVCEEKRKEDKSKKTEVDNMRTFLFKLNEACAMMLCDCSSGFLKMYCRVCPPSYYESAVVPVVVAVFSHMVEHLKSEWEVVRNREIVRPHLANIEAAEIDEEEEADKDSEVIEDHLVHLLTKNFMETFFAMCTRKRPSLFIATSSSAQETTDDPPIKPDSTDDILEELPKFLLKHPETCKIVLFLPFIAMQWPDTASFVKAAKLCVPFIKQIVQNPPIGVAMSTEMFEQLFTLALQSLQLFGHQVEIQSQLIRNAIIIYDILRPLFPSLKNIILQVPNVDAAVLNNYDLVLLSDNIQTEKQKKKIFKELLSGLIGKEIGKMFQNDITILNLPAMPVVKKETPLSLLDTENKDLGLTRLFEPTKT